MIYVALTEAVALVVLVFAYGGLILNLERRHGRRVDSMLDKVLHLSGRTWTPPPADNGQEELPDPRLALIVPDDEPDY